MLDRRRYRKVFVRIWGSPDFQRMTEGERLLALYLLSGPQTNRVGLFRVSFGAAAEDLKCSVRDVQRRLNTVCTSFGWSFDAEAKVLFIPSWWSFNLSSENEKNFRGCLSDLNELPRTALISRFCHNLADVPLSLHKHVEQWEATLTPIEHRSNTDRTQETRQDKQEQEQDSALTRGGESSGGLQRIRESRALEQRRGFDAFWNEYPRKVGKEAAWKEWQRVNPDGELVQRIIAAVREQRASAQWLKDGGQFIPHGRTWIHQHRWEDDVRPSAPSVSKRTMTLAQSDAEFIGGES